MYFVFDSKQIIRIIYFQLQNYNVHEKDDSYLGVELYEYWAESSIDFYLPALCLKYRLNISKQHKTPHFYSENPNIS